MTTEKYAKTQIAKSKQVRHGAEVGPTKVQKRMGAIKVPAKLVAPIKGPHGY